MCTHITVWQASCLTINNVDFVSEGRSLIDEIAHMRRQAY